MAIIAESEISNILAYITPSISQHLKSRGNGLPSKPFVLALTGMQGSGKSTWARLIHQFLTEHYSYKVITLSLDDLYYDHANLVRIREADPNNKLFQTRGHPGTHDRELGLEFFASLARPDGKDALVPAFDKSRFSGDGDRVPQSEWTHVQPPIDVLIFEGWCVGFLPLSGQSLEEKWHTARAARTRESQTSPESISSEVRNGYLTTTLSDHELDHLKLVNSNLSQYCQSFMGPGNFDYLIHLDATALVNVYEWRIDQEHALRRERGAGMSDEQVVRFVQGYMPGYELYLDQLRREPFFKDDPNYQSKGQLKLVLDKGRKVVEISEPVRE